MTIFDVVWLVDDQLVPNDDPTKVLRGFDFSRGILDQASLWSCQLSNCHPSPSGSNISIVQGVIYYHTMPAFKKYLRPTTVEECISFLSRYGQDARILAGGTDLLVLMRSRKLTPLYLVDISGVRELNGIRLESGSLTIGALIRLRQAELSNLVQSAFPLLHSAIGQMATIQIRNMATLVGNVCRASPAADSIPPLLVLEASLEIAGPGQKKTVALANFLTGPGSTVLQPSEMVTGIAIPCLPEGASTSFLRITRVAADLSKVNAAVMIRLQGNICIEARIALGGVGPTAFRSRRAEDSIRGKVLDPEAIEQAASLSSQESRPITDVRSSLEYRREMCQVLVSRAITNCAERIQR